jgi:hypothetical protein
MGVINSVMYKASVFVILKNFLFTLTNTLAFLHYRINYGHKKFYDTCPRCLCYSDLIKSGASVWSNLGHMKVLLYIKTCEAQTL